jgi:hypothetical protein
MQYCNAIHAVHAVHAMQPIIHTYSTYIHTVLLHAKYVHTCSHMQHVQCSHAMHITCTYMQPACCAILSLYSRVRTYMRTCNTCNAIHACTYVLIRCDARSRCWCVRDAVLMHDARCDADACGAYDTCSDARCMMQFDVMRARCTMR